MLEGCCIVRPTMTTTSQGRMISDAGGGRESSTDARGNSAAASAFHSTENPREDGDDHVDIGMDLSSAEEEDGDLVSSSIRTRKDELSSIPPIYTSSREKHLGNNDVGRELQQQQQHVTDDSEASTAPEYSKKRRRRPSESTSPTPSPNHSSTTPPHSQPLSIPQNEDYSHHRQKLEGNPGRDCQDDDPVAVSSGSSATEGPARNSISTKPAPTATANLTNPPPPISTHPFIAQVGETQQQDCQQQRQDVASSSSSATPTTSSVPLHHYQNEREVTPVDNSYRSTPASIKLRETLLSRLSMAYPTGRIQVLDLSRRGLTESNAELISNALRCNITLAVLKLGYNDLGDRGTTIIASSCSKEGRHHPHLTVLDLAFNEVGDEGCAALSLHMVAGNHTLRNLSLAGNNIRKNGATALAGAIIHGCSLSRLHLSNNRLGGEGTRVLAQAIAESEARVQQLLQRQGGIKLGYNIKPVTMEELHLDGATVKERGLTTISSMLLTNFNLQTLSLANNNVTDQDMALLSQALAQNKNLPLKSLILSFNNISCVGVECLMNSVWGSATLREVKLDNNKMQDRGAQLCAVVLGSIQLEALDISYNKITTVGVKALMKSLSENNSLQHLALCGIAMDQNGSKAVSYAIAYNESLEKFNIDSCSVGYSGQRHIVAGIVSNRNVNLRVLTGFPLGPITMTLGVPQLPEDWGNDRVLSFIRYMWAHWKTTLNVDPLDAGVGGQNSVTRGPAAPSMVASAAKKAFASLSHDDDAKILYQKEHHSKVVEDNPMIAPETSILVRSLSGRNLQMLSWDDRLNDAPAAELKPENTQDSWESDTDSLDRSSYTGSSESLRNVLMTASSVDNVRRNRNLGWLRSHMQSLVEIGNLSFNNADLWQLHQYFFSPAYSEEDDLETDTGKVDSNASTPDNPPTPASSEAEKPDIAHAISFQSLKKAVFAAAAEEEAKRPNKRGSLDEELKNHRDEPSPKRPKQLRPRIAYYPRVREKLESLGTKPSTQTLCLLRQLKYVESVMLRGKNVYSRHQQHHEQQESHLQREQEDEEFPSTNDVEMVLLDLL